MYRGARIAGSDYFDDVFGQDNPQGSGILKGGGIAGYEGIREEMTPEGIAVKMACRNCGKEVIVTLEWEELFVCGANGPGMPLLLPQNWKYSENNATMYPSLGCNKCGAGESLCPHVTPDECRRHVNAAANRGLINPQQAQQWKQKIEMHRGGGG